MQDMKSMQSAKGEGQRDSTCDTCSFAAFRTKGLKWQEAKLLLLILRSLCPRVYRQKNGTPIRQRYVFVVLFRFRNSSS